MPTLITKFYEEDVKVVASTMENLQLNSGHCVNDLKADDNNVGVFSIDDFEKPTKSDGWEANHVFKTSKAVDFFALTRKKIPIRKGKKSSMKKSSPVVKRSICNSVLKKKNSKETDGSKKVKKTIPDYFRYVTKYV